ncbi:MAG TPA: ThuA domain-containing protein [Bryobacteraceae bacterium]|nr:ThuA domain-containing protein [Bryobacteraceae bacterium]
MPSTPDAHARRLSRRGFLGAGSLALGSAAGAHAPKTIVFIADRPSHEFGGHECNAGCLLLAKCLEQNVPGVRTVVHRNGWPADQALGKPAAVVMITNGGPNHPAARHLDELEGAMRAGAGLAAVHWALGGGERCLDWLGGYYEPNWSVNPFWTARFTELTEHPVTRGVKPFAIYDEWYFNMRFRPGMAGVTPLLTAVPPESTRQGPFGPHTGNPTVRARKGMPEHVAWAYERPGGGRGFGFTGAHYHWAWGVDDFRKIVLNGIAWSAGITIPANGIRSATPSWEALLENLDKPMPSGFTREQAEAAIRPR